MDPLKLKGVTHRFGQGDVVIEGVGGGGIYFSVTGFEGHATISKEDAEQLRDWLTAWLLAWLPASQTADIGSDATLRQTKRQG